jgi:GNAT superfamily N-acetyltransferase
MRARAGGVRAGTVTVAIDDSVDGVDWDRVKADLAADDFDNGRSPEGLRRSFEQAQHVAVARDGDSVVGLARMLSDGVCNAYVVDVWTRSSHRHRGVATAMMERLLDQVPGLHVGLQTDDADGFYRTLGFRPQPQFLSVVVGTWLGNDANR